MDFNLSNLHKMVRDVTREFAEEYIAPIVAESDQKSRLDPRVMEEMKRMKFFGINIPQEYGGAGLDTLGFVIATEEIGRVDASYSVTFAVPASVCSYPIYIFGTEDQKERFLPGLSSGEKLGAFVLTEANAGSDAQSVQLTATKDGDEYILNGNKIFATNGGIAKTLLVVTTTGKVGRRKELTMFIVNTDTPGYSVGVREKKLGLRASNTSELVFQDVRVPEKNILGKRGDGFKLTLAILDYGRILMAAQIVGLGQACLEKSIRYANERVQFGRPIGSFQGIQYKIADMATEIEASRLLTYKAACLCDNGENYGLIGSMAKLYASEATMRAANQAIQIHGAYGLTKSYDVERYFRDAKMAEIYEGTSEIQRMVIGSSLLRKSV